MKTGARVDLLLVDVASDIVHGRIRCFTLGLGSVSTSQSILSRGSFRVATEGIVIDLVLVRARLFILLNFGLGSACVALGGYLLQWVAFIARLV